MAYKKKSIDLKERKSEMWESYCELLIKPEWSGQDLEVMHYLTENMEYLDKCIKESMESTVPYQQVSGK